MSNTLSLKAAEVLIENFRYEEPLHIGDAVCMMFNDGQPRIMMTDSEDSKYIVISFSTIALPVEVSRVTALLLNEEFDLEVSKDFYVNTKGTYFGMEAHTNSIKDIIAKGLESLKQQDRIPKPDDCLLDEKVFVSTKKIYMAGPKDLMSPPAPSRFKDFLGIGTKKKGKV